MDNYDTTGHPLWPYDDEDESEIDEYDISDLFYSDYKEYVKQRKQE